MSSALKMLAPLTLTAVVLFGVRADDQKKPQPPDQAQPDKNPQPEKPPQHAGAFLGVQLPESQAAGEKGIHVMNVMPGGPAATAGLKAGDVIVKIDGKDAPDLQAFKTMLGNHKVGDKLALTVHRDGKDQEIKVTLGEQPRELQPGLPGRPGLPPGQAAGGAFLGIEFGQQPGAQGIAVGRVFPDTAAAKAGLKERDVIVKIDGKNAPDMQGFMTMIAHHKPGDKLTLTVMREGKEQEVKVTLGERPRQ